MLVAASALAQETLAPTPTRQPSTATTHKPRTPRPEPPPYNVNTIFLDPAHGGDDPGARLGSNSLEKDATLAFSERLRILLTKDAFTLVTTRTIAPDLSATDATNLDQRVELANRSRAVACLILHATGAGHGIHLYTSSLPVPASSAADVSGHHPLVPWNTAQTASLQASQQLAADLAAAIDGLRIPLITGHVSVKPIDSLTCPAILVELAPLASGASHVIASDRAYQERVAQALASGLHVWRAHAQAQIQAEMQAQIQAQAQTQNEAPTGAKPQSSAPTAQNQAGTSKPKSAPKPTRIPEEIPEVLPPAPVLPPRPPAPIVRRPAPPVSAPAPVPVLPPTPPPGVRP